MARNAGQILDAGIKEIAAGRWCQGDLDVKNGEVKHCAVGIISFYGGDFYPEEDAVLNYTSGASPANCQRALKALYEALPKQFREEQEIYHRAIQEHEIGSAEQMCDAVVTYNDKQYTTQGRALAWFRKARKVISG